MNKNENELHKIDSVKNKMSFFYNENNNLYHKIVDCKQTLEINFEILKTTFISSGGNEKIINDSITNGKSLLNKYENIIQKRKEIQKDIYSLRHKLEIKKNKINNEIENYAKENEKLLEEIKTKDNNIKILKEDLIKLRQKAYFKKAREEIKVCPPIKSSVLINQEIINEKNIFQKAKNIYLEKEKIEKKLQDKYKSLYEQLKKESEDKNIKIDEINELKFEEEDEYENKESSSEEEPENPKKKHMNLDYYKKKYKNLQNEIKHYQKQIEKYKEQYKDYQKKINYLKNKESKRRNILK